MISPESKILDAISEEAQKAKEQKRQVKKQRRAIEKAQGTPRQRKKDKYASVETTTAGGGLLIPRLPCGRPPRIEEESEAELVEDEPKSADDLLDTVVIGVRVATAGFRGKDARGGGAFDNQGKFLKDAEDVVATIVVDTLGSRKETLDSSQSNCTKGHWREIYRNNKAASQQKKARDEHDKRIMVTMVRASAAALVEADTGINDDQLVNRASGTGAAAVNENHIAVIDGDTPTIVDGVPLGGRHALGDFSRRPRFSSSKMFSTAKMFTTERMFSPTVSLSGKYVRGGGGHDNHSKSLKELKKMIL